MTALEELQLRKRERPLKGIVHLESEPIAKKQKPCSKSYALARHRPQRFWDTLSKIRLTSNSLREFDHRNIEEKLHSPYTFTSKVKHFTELASLRLKKFAQYGGPDLSHLRGLANLSLSTLDRMSDSTSSQNRERSFAFSKRSKSFKITPYSGNFEQKLIDNGVYPSLYEHPDGRPSQDPMNLSDIEAAQCASRKSLSPSRFTQGDFEAFRRANARSSGENTGMRNVISVIAGNEATHRFEIGLPLKSLKSFDKALSDPAPDVYYGSALSTIHPRVITDLGPYIIPSTANTTRPAAPNFFVETKSAQGRADVAQRQVLIDGAIGARAMHQLQNYKAKESEYDNKARSFSATYHAGTGTLQTYAHHLTKPPSPGEEPEYHMTQAGSYAMTHNAKSFRKGAAAYRNIRDLAKTERDRSITHANQVACEMPAPKPNKSRPTRRKSQLTAIVTELDSSEDELALDKVTTVKSLRSSSAPSMSYGSTGKRDGRAASGVPMAVSRPHLAPSLKSMSTSRRSKRPSAEGNMPNSTNHTLKMDWADIQ